MTHLIEVAIINEQAFVVWNGDNAATACDDLCGIVGCALAHCERKFSAEIQPESNSRTSYGVEIKRDLPRVVGTEQDIRHCVTGFLSRETTPNL